MAEDRGSLITRQLYRKILPLIVNRFMRFKEKHGSDKEGFVMELKRLNVLDEPEMERMTHGYFLNKEPTLVWLIEWTLIYEMRKLFDTLYGVGGLDFPYIVVNPYKFIGHLFQVVASQWLITQGADMSIQEMDKFLKECLREHLERNVPIVPHIALGPSSRHKNWREENLQLHQRLWSDFPDLRPYIHYHDDWFRRSTTPDSKTPVQQDPQLTKELRQLTDSIKQLLLQPPSPQQQPAPQQLPPPPPQQQQQKAAPTVKNEKDPAKKIKEVKRGGSKRTTDSDSDSDGLPMTSGSTITAKLHSDEDDDDEPNRKSSDSSESDSD